MNRNRGLTSVYLLISILVLFASTIGGAAAAAPAPAGASLSANATVFSTGFNNPRGLKFGPDGLLYVAEGGLGGTHSTVGKCEQVPAPVGPYTGEGTTGRISQVDSSGQRTTFLDGLPSSQTSPAAASFASGVADVAFVGRVLYATITGAGCSHGFENTPNSVLRVEPNGHWQRMADLSAYYLTHPVAQPNPPDYEPDGTPYSMIAVDGSLYVVEPNHGELDKVSLGGKVTRIVDISATEGHIVPTAMTYHDGAFYVGNLHDFPASPEAKIMRISLDGEITTVATGLTLVLGVAFDSSGRLYALEASAPVTDPNGPPVLPGTGRVVRISPSGTLEPIATGLDFPTAMTFGPDGKLYVSNHGYHLGPAPAGLGEIVKITVPD